MHQQVWGYKVEEKIYLGVCKQKQLNITHLENQTLYHYSLDIYSVTFVVKNRDQFLSNLEFQDINTRKNPSLHLPLANLTLYQKGVFCAGNKIYNHRQLLRIYQSIGNILKQL
jgi:hypothetical protein